jgi:hypothetical protein
MGVAQDVLRDLTSELLIRGLPVPKPLSWYAVLLLSGNGPKRKRGISHCALWGRNRDIVEIIRQLTKAPFDLKATRNEATRRAESACSIVAAALRKLGVPNLKGGPMREENVKQIWDTQHDWEHAIAPLVEKGYLTK